MKKIIAISVIIIIKIQITLTWGNQIILIIITMKPVALIFIPPIIWIIIAIPTKI